MMVRSAASARHIVAQIARYASRHTIDHKMANIRFSQPVARASLPLSPFASLTLHPSIRDQCEMDGACVFFELKIRRQQAVRVLLHLPLSNARVHEAIAIV